MQVVPQVAPPMTFCNVRWNRDGGAAQLSREPVHLVPGEGLCRFVNGFYEIDPSLPHQEIAVAVDHAVASLSEVRVMTVVLAGGVIIVAIAVMYVLSRRRQSPYRY